ncbi:acylphosphatase [Flindersiella endophytica]
MSVPLTRSRVVCHGRVHGVFFRDTCRRNARKLGLAGWVRNRGDGSVEAVFEGSPAAVGKMIDWSRTGPPTASVTTVDVIDEPVEGLSGFQIRPTA